MNIPPADTLRSIQYLRGPAVHLPVGLIARIARFIRWLASAPASAPTTPLEAEMRALGERDADMGVLNPPSDPGLRQDAYLAGHALAEAQTWAI